MEGLIWRLRELVSTFLLHRVWSGGQEGQHCPEFVEMQMLSPYHRSQRIKICVLTESPYESSAVKV